MFKNNSPFIRVVCLVICIQAFCGCKKYLDLKPNAKQVEPSTLTDLQALMDTYTTVNFACPVLLLVASDEYYLTNSTYASRNVDVQNNYIWNSEATDIASWQYAYQSVYYSNIILSRINDVVEGSLNDINDVKGQALFFRGFVFWHIAQLYCKPYSSENLNELGIPLRKSPDITVKTARSTVAQTYDQIIEDLKAAVELLPEKSIGITRPIKATAYGALARTYLSMRDYTNAQKYADSCLGKSSSILDFNTINASSSSPIDPYTIKNPENLLFAILPASGVPSSSTLVDTVLYKSYEADDLRKSVLFSSANGGYILKGSYGGTTSAYNGIASNEMYLIRAECAARSGNKDSALADLNRLLVKRYRTNKYVTLTTANTTDVLAKVLMERRKELVYRGLRWSDIRRLNLDGANITLSRIVNGTTYTLSPNDIRTVMLIPREVINQTNIEQNPR